MILLPPANEVWGKVIFSVACVKNSVHREGCLPQCMLGYHPLGADTPQEQPPPGADTPRSRHPLGADTPQEQTPPTSSKHPPSVQCMLGDTVNKRAVCILLECNLVLHDFILHDFILHDFFHYICHLFIFFHCRYRDIWKKCCCVWKIQKCGNAYCNVIACWWNWWNSSM